MTDNYVWQLAAPRVVAAVQPDVKAAVPRVSKATRVAVVSTPRLREGTEVASAAEWSSAKRPFPRGSPAKPAYTPATKENCFSCLPLEVDDAPPKSSFKGPRAKLAPPTKSQWSGGAIILAAVAVLAICTGGLCGLVHTGFVVTNATADNVRSPPKLWARRVRLSFAEKVL